MDKMEEDIACLKIAITEIQQLVRRLSNLKTKPKKKKSMSPTKAGPSAVKIDLLTQVHMQEALRKNVCLFRDLCLDDGHILDRLFECDCITSDEYQVIRSKQTNHEMVRALLFKIRNRAPLTINIFLSVIKEDPANEELFNKFNESLSRIKNENQNRAKCPICVLKATVDIKDIVDTLWSEKIISDETFERVVNQDNMYGSKLTKLFWENVTESIHESDETLEVVIASLQEKYAYLIPSLRDKKGDFLSFECCYCGHQRFHLRNKRPDPFGSLTDLSTTSEYPNSENDSLQSSIYTMHEEKNSSEEVVIRRDKTGNANTRLGNRREKIKMANTLLKRERLSSIVSMADGELILASEPNETTSDRQTNNNIETAAERLKGKSVKGSPRQSVHFNLTTNSVRTYSCQQCQLVTDETHRLFADPSTQTDLVDNTYGRTSKRVDPDEYKREQYKEVVKVVAGASTLCDASSNTEPKDISSNTEPKDISSNTEPKDISSNTEPKDISSNKEPKDTSSNTEPKDVHQLCQTDSSQINPATKRTPVCLKVKYDKPDSASNVQALISLFNRRRRGSNTGMLDLSVTQT